MAGPSRMEDTIEQADDDERPRCRPALLGDHADGGGQFLVQRGLRGHDPSQKPAPRGVVMEQSPHRKQQCAGKRGGGQYAH
jgi:hypothetical protein